MSSLRSATVGFLNNKIDCQTLYRKRINCTFLKCQNGQLCNVHAPGSSTYTDSKAVGMMHVEFNASGDTLTNSTLNIGGTDVKDTLVPSEIVLRTNDDLTTADQSFDRIRIDGADSGDITFYSNDGVAKLLIKNSGLVESNLGSSYQNLILNDGDLVDYGYITSVPSTTQSFNMKQVSSGANYTIDPTTDHVIVFGGSGEALDTDAGEDRIIYLPSIETAGKYKVSIIRYTTGTAALDDGTVTVTVNGSDKILDNDTGVGALTTTRTISAAESYTFICDHAVIPGRWFISST